MTYSDIGLNEFLQPFSSPITQNTTIQAYNVQTSYERSSISNNMVQSIGADKINAGTVVVSINLGASTAGSVILDGGNNRIIVNDGTTNRIVIGSI